MVFLEVNFMYWEKEMCIFFVQIRKQYRFKMFIILEKMFIINYNYKEQVGFYDQDAVEVTITDLQGDKNFVYVVIGYGEQFYGPFSIPASNQ